MKIKTLITVALLCLSFAATGQGQVTAQAYEIALRNFQAPATANGRAAFKECDTCVRKSVRVTPTTRYAVNGEAVRLEDFRKALLQANSQASTAVTLLHHLESDTVKLLDVSL